MSVKGRRLKPKFEKRIKTVISYALILILVVGLCGVFTPVKARAEEDTHTHNGITFEPWTSPNSMPSSGNYYLATDVVLSGNWTIYYDVRLCLNGHSLTMGGVTDSAGCISLQDEAYFALYDEDNTGSVTTVSTDSSTSYGTIFLGSGDAEFEMFGGRLSGTPVKYHSSPESAFTCIRNNGGGTVRIYGGCLERGTEYNIYDTGKGTIEVYNAIYTQTPDPKFIVGGSDKIIANPDPATSTQYPYIVAQSVTTITFDVNGGTGTVDPVRCYSGFKATIPTVDITKDDYKLLGWSTSSTATSADYVAGDSVFFGEDKTLYAVWQENPDQTITAPDEITLKVGTASYAIGASTDGDGALSYAGDTLTSIAAQFKTTIQALVNKNGIKNPDLIFVGQEIKY